MKLKNHDWIEAERRLGAADFQLVQEDRTIRTGLLALAVLGVVLLAGKAVYLVCLSPPLQNSDPGVTALRSRIGN